MSPNRTQVYILQYYLTPEFRGDFAQRFERGVLLSMKRRFMTRHWLLEDLGIRNDKRVMSKYGLDCQPEKVAIKTIDVYQLVQETAERFRLPVPKIAIANIIIPNAAASGPSLT